jgi:hypothetical protein
LERLASAPKEMVHVPAARVPAPRDGEQNCWMPVMEVAELVTVTLAWDVPAVSERAAAPLPALAAPREVLPHAPR